MNTWTKQSGYPVLSVTISGDQIKLKQQRFFLRKPKSVSAVDQKWWIPITWASNSKPEFSLTTTEKWINGDELVRVERRPNDWVIFNVQAAGESNINKITNN